MYLYLMKNGDYYKIGVSKNPQTRLEGLQTANPLPIEIIRSVDLGFVKVEKVEYWLHVKYKDFRSQGEWFYFDPIVLFSVECDFDLLAQAEMSMQFVKEDYFPDEAKDTYESWKEISEKNLAKN